MPDFEKHYLEKEQLEAEKRLKEIKRMDEISLELISRVLPYIKSYFEKHPPENYNWENINGKRTVVMPIQEEKRLDSIFVRGIYLLGDGSLFYKNRKLASREHSAQIFAEPDNKSIIYWGDKDSRVECAPSCAYMIMKVAKEYGAPDIKRDYWKNIHGCKPPRGCYIATAVYGSYEAPEVRVLRKFRDEVLQRSFLGRLFITTYYQLSPPVAERLKGAKRSNRFVKSLLDRWVERLRNKKGY